jgi:hypothetical protein
MVVTPVLPKNVAAKYKLLNDEHDAQTSSLSRSRICSQHFNDTNPMIYSIRLADAVPPRRAKRTMAEASSPPSDVPLPSPDDTTDNINRQSVWVLVHCHANPLFTSKVQLLKSFFFSASMQINAICRAC